MYVICVRMALKGVQPFICLAQACVPSRDIFIRVYIQRLYVSICTISLCVCVGESLCVDILSGIPLITASIFLIRDMDLLPNSVGGGF